MNKGHGVVSSLLVQTRSEVEYPATTPPLRRHQKLTLHTYGTFEFRFGSDKALGREQQSI